MSWSSAVVVGASGTSSAPRTASGSCPASVDAGEPGDGDAVGEVVGEDAGDLQGQAGLPDAAGSEDGDQPVPLEQRADATHILVPAEERGEPQWEPTGRGRWRSGPRRSLRNPRGRPDRRSLLQDRLLQGPQFGARGEAQFGVEHVPCSLVGGQGIALAAGPVQREHQPGVQAFTQRMLRGERLQVGDHLRVASGGQLEVDLLLSG